MREFYFFLIRALFLKHNYCFKAKTGHSNHIFIKLYPLCDVPKLSSNSELMIVLLMVRNYRARGNEEP